MKKLLGTTALVAAAFATAPAMAADKIKMKVGGYFVGSVAAVFDADLGAGGATDERTIRFGRESEVHFKGSTTLDNGIEIGVKFELETGEDSGRASRTTVNDANGNGTIEAGEITETAGRNGNDIVDEAYIWVEGAFGEFQFGDQDGVGDQMPIVAPSPFLEHFANDTDLDPIGGVFDAGINTVADFSGDSTKIIYFTPRLAGFQVGLSYAPENAELSGDESYSDAISGDDTYENIFEAGLTWEYGFNGVDLGASFVYVTAEDNGIGVNDVDDWALGASVGFGGFTVGGAYGEKESASIGNEEYKAWDIGVTYGTGPWTFGVEYAEANVDGAAGAADPVEDTAIIGGVAYSLGGGANVSLGYKYGEGEFRNREGSALFTEFGVKF